MLRGSLFARPFVFFAALKKLGLACGHPSAALGLRRLRRLLDLAIFCPAEHEESYFTEN